jgi:hypothetical protein
MQWARVHKVDRVKPQPGGGAIVIVEDDRNAGAMARVPSLSTLIAIARILNARRVLETKYNGTGEVRYATIATPPGPLADAIARAGASVSDRTGDTVRTPAMPASVESIVDTAFADLAYYMRSSVGVSDMVTALRVLEERRRKQPLNRDENPEQYWSAVFELAALAGELSRARGGRWIATKDLPVPFALKLAEGGIAMPTKLAQQIVEGGEPLESMATEVT